MKRLLLIFFVLTVVISAHAGLVKREEESVEGGLTGLMQKIKNFAMKLPFVGELIGDTIGKLIDWYEKLQEMTDGAIGRLLGGAFPCTLTLDSFACSGTTLGDNLSTMVGKMLKPLPSMFFPDGLKDIIEWSIDFFVEPVLDVVFGGVTKPEAAQN
ncbi:uncharacterized protein LOC130671159 [Microplitis mediator]|uniref:uncharacterized protein LOC130671159 n=1 Tax=Microplitis mediator TaxID=375433 RepID=UPI00255694DD|nr:uncharacterized protein LOC130671159 [Microplitis mediator]